MTDDNNIEIKVKVDTKDSKSSFKDMADLLKKLKLNIDDITEGFKKLNPEMANFINAVKSGQVDLNGNIISENRLIETTDKLASSTRRATIEQKILNAERNFNTAKVNAQIGNIEIPSEILDLSRMSAGNTNKALIDNTNLLNAKTQAINYLLTATKTLEDSDKNLIQNNEKSSNIQSESIKRVALETRLNNAEKSFAIAKQTALNLGVELSNDITNTQTLSIGKSSKEIRANIELLNAKTQATYKEIIAKKLSSDANTQLGNTLTNTTKLTSAMTRELIVIGHEALTGRFSRIPGSMMVLAEYANTTTSSIKMLGGALAIFTTFEVGKSLKEAAESAAKFDEANHKLALGLGTSPEIASKLNLQLKLIGASSTEYMDLAIKLDRQVRANSKSLTEHGMIVKDVNGDFLSQSELMINAVKWVNSYKDGTDRNIAAQYAFGRNLKDVEDIMKSLSPSTQKTAEEMLKFSNTTTQLDVERAEKYKQSINRLSIVFEELSNNTGRAVMPLLTNINNWFSDNIPVIISQVKKLSDAIVSMIKEIGVGINSLLDGALADLISGINTIYEGFKRLAVVSSNLVTTRGLGIISTFKKITGDDEGAKFYNEIANESLKNTTISLKTGKFENFDNVTNKSKEFELLGHDSNLNNGTKSATGLSEEYKKVIAEVKKANEEKAKMDLEDAESQIKHAKDVAEGRMALANEENRHKLAMGQETTSKYYEIEMSNLMSLKEIELSSINESIIANENYYNTRKQLANNNFVELQKIEREHSKSYNKLIEEKQKVDNKYNLEKTKLQNKQNEEEKSRLDSIGNIITNGFESMTEKLIRGTATFRDAFRVLCGDLVVEFAKSQVSMVAKALWTGNMKQLIEEKNLAFKIATSAKERAIDLATKASEVGAWLWSSGVKTAIQTKDLAFKIAIAIKEKAITFTTALMERGAAAAVAAAKAYSAMAGIPFVGPAVGAAAAAATFAGVMAFGIPSASGGWGEVPNDGLAMIHKKEMVLPANLAEGVRNMINNSNMNTNSSNTSNHTYNFNISAVDGNSVKDMFMKHGGVIVNSLNTQIRNLNSNARSY